MVQASGAGEGEQFLIRKQTMIVKNTKSIDEVYRRDAKVSMPDCNRDLFSANNHKNLLNSIIADILKAYLSLIMPSLSYQNILNEKSIITLCSSFVPHKSN